MRTCVLLLPLLVATGCSLKYEPVPAASAPPYMIERVAEAYPGSTLEHVTRYTPPNPAATDYPRWRGLVFQYGRVAAVAYAGIGRVVFEASDGEETAR